MKEKKPALEMITVVGSNNVAYSIAACLLAGGHHVNLCTNNTSRANKIVYEQLAKEKSNGSDSTHTEGELSVLNHLDKAPLSDIYIAITLENEQIKSELLLQIDKILPADGIMAINSESIALDVLQSGLKNGSKLIGLNWSEPAHTTRFLEIIKNDKVSAEVVTKINHLANVHWHKKPYQVENFGIRSRLMSAMIREAFYLVENGYATLEDIDRACRNDAGYYLPFVGNCRYMDLMGTYAYGMVMKDLNPHLSKAKSAPEFFKQILKEGGEGMKNGKGLYQYKENEIKMWRRLFDEFSYRIEEVIDKYPFNYD